MNTVSVQIKRGNVGTSIGVELNGELAHFDICFWEAPQRKGVVIVDPDGKRRCDILDGEVHIIKDTLSDGANVQFIIVDDDKDDYYGIVLQY